MRQKIRPIFYIYLEENREEQIGDVMTTPSELTELIKHGEGPMIEFKKSDFLSHSEELAKLMVAFANTQGGKILIGIDDKGNLEGMKAKEGHKGHIINIARNNCDPPIFPEFEVVKMDGGDVYVINVMRFMQYPHALKIRGGKAYYIRVGPTVREPSPQELAMLFAGGTFPTKIKSTEMWEEKEDSIRWEIFVPKSLPDPLDLISYRKSLTKIPHFESWMLDSPIYFTIKFKMTNNGDEPLNLLIEIWSDSQVIIFSLMKPIKKWVWRPIPHRKLMETSLDNALQIEIPGKGQSVEFTFDALYRPKFVKPLLSRRAILNYKFYGRTPLGVIFESGPHRLEIPIAEHKEKSSEKPV